MKSLSFRLFCVMLFFQFACYGFYRMYHELTASLLRSFAIGFCFLSGVMSILFFLLVVGSIFDLLRYEKNGQRDSVEK